jgi:hypothetical protein
MLNKIIITTLIIIIAVLLRYDKVNNYVKESLNLKHEIEPKTIKRFCIKKTHLCNEKGHCLIDCHSMRCFVNEKVTRCIRLNDVKQRLF